MNQRPDIHGTREELVAFIADQQAEIGRLRFMGSAKDNANKAYAERNAVLAEEIKRVRGRHERDIAAMADMVTERDMEVERLRTALEEYACTGTDHPCGCYDLLSKEKTEIKWLRAALQRIVDNGEQSGFAYGVAFAALRASKEELDDLPRTAG